MPLNIHLTALSLASSDAARDVLLHESDKWFGWLVGSTVAVLVGVAFEAPEGIVDLIDWIGARRQLRWVRTRNGISSEDDPAHWTKAVSFLGLALVVLGVCGEGVFEILVSRADAAVRTHDETAIESANQKAGEAKISAHDAGVDATIAKTSAKQAGIDAGTAKNLAAEAEEQAAQAESDRAAALERTARLEAQLSWRTVTPDQEKKIKDFLAPFLAKSPLAFLGVKIGFTYLTGDPEGAEYAQELEDALRKSLKGSGAEFSDPLAASVFGSKAPPTGVILQVHSNTDSTSVRAGWIQKALKTAGIESPGQVNAPEMTINLFVATKPRAVSGNK